MIIMTTPGQGCEGGREGGVWEAGGRNKLGSAGGRPLIIMIIISAGGRSAIIRCHYNHHHQQSEGGRHKSYGC